MTPEEARTCVVCSARWRLADVARAQAVADIERVWEQRGLNVELAWHGRTDLATRLVLSLSLVAVGDERSVHCGSLPPAGGFHLHLHPSGHLTPSAADLEFTEALARLRPSSGVAIVDRFLRELRVLREPSEAPPIPRPRTWSMGRWLVVRNPRHAQ